jgi:hypothetical protein
MASSLRPQTPQLLFGWHRIEHAKAPVFVPQGSRSFASAGERLTVSPLESSRYLSFRAIAACCAARIDMLRNRAISLGSATAPRIAKLP